MYVWMLMEGICNRNDLYTYTYGYGYACYEKEVRCVCVYVGSRLRWMARWLDGVSVVDDRYGQRAVARGIRRASKVRFEQVTLYVYDIYV